MKTWSDSEAALVRQILEHHDIPCQVVSDIPHAVMPIAVDGLGEIRIRVPESRLRHAQEVLAEHRRRGLEVIQGGKDDADEEPGDDEDDIRLGRG